MAEVKEKTPEEKLLESAKAGEGSSGGDKNAGGDGDERTPEEKMIDELKGNLEAANKRAESAEARADSERTQKDSARQEAKTEAQKRIETQEGALKTAVEGAKNKFDSARKDWREARDSGDSAKEEEALIKMNDAQMEYRGAEFQEKNFKVWKEGNSANDGNVRREKLFTVKTATGDSINVPQSGFDWINAHPRFKNDPEYAEAVYAADAISKSRNIAPFSKEHTDFIEKQLKKNGFDDEDSTARRESEGSKKDESSASIKKSDKQSTAAPPNGSPGSGSGASKKQTFVMTSDHRRAAQFTFPDDYKKDPKAAEEKYARYQLEIQAKKARGEL